MNLHTSKIGKLLPICLTHNRCRSGHIYSKPHAKFGENRYRIVGVVVPQWTNRTKTGICTSLKSDLYFQSHLPLSTSRRCLIVTL